MRPYVISRHLPICKNGKKDINSIVGECPSIGRIGRRLAVIIREDVRQQNPCRSLCFLPRVAAGVLQRVREDGDETGILRRLPWRSSLTMSFHDMLHHRRWWAPCECDKHVHRENRHRSHLGNCGNRKPGPRGMDETLISKDFGADA